MADEWRDQALCAGMMGAFERQPLDEQKAMCGRCPVSADCLALGLEVTRSLGPNVSMTECVYGGLTVREQQALAGRRPGRTGTPGCDTDQRLSKLLRDMAKGRPVAEIIAEWGIAANTAYQWVGRHAPEHLDAFRPLMNAEASAQKRARAAARRQAREEAAA